MSPGPQPMLDVATSVHDGFVHVVPRGEIDAATAQHLAAALETVGSQRVILDLRELNFMDSSGLRIILRAADRAAHSSSYELFVARGPRRIQRVFEIARVADRIRWVDDPAELHPPG